ncbi:MAG: DUF4492 domain-containing protein [Prolixibacteraceae bacterium]|nr:DUF4492 domain-containing protein [Prolixibacteraceae bacterium]MBN2773889.1 DUF4492 domain-containing protein [Prolixibacteraceae bacterium]
MEKKTKNIFSGIWHFYFQGFRDMGKWGKQVWIIILVKLFIMFAILRIFFFPDFLKTNFNSDKERSEHVLENLTEPKNYNL